MAALKPHCKRVYVCNKRRDSCIATEAAVADGYFSRLIGLGKTSSWAQPGRGLWIIPSHGVHTLECCSRWI
jgi:hypothetical protein